MGLLFGLDLERLRLLRVRPKYRDEVLEFPLLDVIVHSIHTMDIPLNGIPLVTNHKSVSISRR